MPLIEVIGPDGLKELEELVEKKIHATGVTKEDWRQILTRLDILEHDMEEVKTDYREFRREMNEFRKEVNERFDRMNERFDRMNERFDRMYGRMGSWMKWTVGTIAFFGTLITVLVGIGQLTR